MILPIRPLFLHHRHQSFLPDFKTWALPIRTASHHLPLGQLLAGLDKDFLYHYIYHRHYGRHGSTLAHGEVTT